ncbi:MAG: hypothetical protein Q8K86_07155 [Candidatus Nanopelagicaceae bacterium]|nr:hypothetical protein [Candidatus Nanopelagicaceae bacterium]
MNLTITNHFHDGSASHTGDAVLSRPVIIKIRDTFKDIRITLRLASTLHYLFTDLGLPLVALNSPLVGPTYNAWFGWFPDILNIHNMTYNTQVFSFNRQMEQQRLPFRLTTEIQHPMLKFPDVNFPPVAPRSVLVENGACNSHQNYADMNSIIPKLLNDFRDLTFYTSSLPPVVAANLCNCGHLDLISLSHLGDRCLALLTRGSGVNAVCYTEINRNKPRAILGWNYRWKLWDDAFVRCKSYEEVYIFLKGATR